MGRIVDHQKIVLGYAFRHGGSFAEAARVN
jgi:hypothetical protein